MSRLKVFGQVWKEQEEAQSKSWYRSYWFVHAAMHPQPFPAASHDSGHQMNAGSRSVA